jgi:hypothetical protein
VAGELHHGRLERRIVAENGGDADIPSRPIMSISMESPSCIVAATEIIPVMGK